MFLHMLPSQLLQCPCTWRQRLCAWLPTLSLRLQFPSFANGGYVFHVSRLFRKDSSFMAPESFAKIDVSLSRTWRQRFAWLPTDCSFMAPDSFANVAVSFSRKWRQRLSWPPTLSQRVQLPSLAKKFWALSPALFATD